MNKDKSQTFSVKVPKWVWDLINIIAESREHGSNGNDLIKKCLMFVIESAKIDGPLPVEFKTLLNMLKLDTSWHNAFNFADAGATMDIAQVVLVLQQRNEDGTPRKGFGLAMISKPFFSDAHINLCVDDILERLVEVSMPGLYKDLREIGDKIGSTSVRETLTTLCDAHLIKMLDEEFEKEMPQIGNYSDFGDTIDNQRYKTIKRRTVDGENMQQKIVFVNSDETSDKAQSYGDKADQYLHDLEERVKQEHADELERSQGFRPFTSEW